MARRFDKLTRPRIRALAAGEKITEHGICAERLDIGDVRYTVNIMVDGERIHRVIGRESENTTRSQAEEFIEKARSEAREGRLNLPKGRKLHLTFFSAADLYLTKLKEIGGKDYTNNEQHIRLHLAPYFRNMRLDRISEFTIQKYQKHCRDKGLAETTTNRTLATYRRMGRRLVKWRVTSVVLPMVKLKKEENQREQVISAEEEKRLVEAALHDSNSYIWLFIRLGLATGLRHTELLTARFDGFDAKTRRLRVKAKGGKWRKQPLTRGIVDLLEREREMATDQDGWIFPSARTKSGHQISLGKPFARCIKRAGLNPNVIVPHVMRHTAITRLSENADIKTIQEFSGHETVAMVLRYAHPQDDAINRALDRMEGGTIVEHPAARKRKDS
jgi:integrase